MPEFLNEVPTVGFWGLRLRLSRALAVVSRLKSRDLGPD